MFFFEPFIKYFIKLLENRILQQKRKLFFLVVFFLFKKRAV